MGAVAFLAQVRRGWADRVAQGQDERKGKTMGTYFTGSDKAAVLAPTSAKYVFVDAEDNVLVSADTRSEIEAAVRDFNLKGRTRSTWTPAKPGDGVAGFQSALAYRAFYHANA